MLKKIIVIMLLLPSFSMANHHGNHDHKVDKKAMKEMKKEYKTACREEMKLSSKEDVKAGKAEKPTRKQRKALKKCVKTKFAEAGKEMPDGKKMKNKMKGKMKKASSDADS